MREWVGKPVMFKRTDQADMELYAFARKLPNFTALVKGWLYDLKQGNGRPSNEWIPSREITLQEQEEVFVEVDASQFF